MNLRRTPIDDVESFRAMQDRANTALWLDDDREPTKPPVRTVERSGEIDVGASA